MDQLVTRWLRVSLAWSSLVGSIGITHFYGMNAIAYPEPTAHPSDTSLPAAELLDSDIIRPPSSPTDSPYKQSSKEDELQSPSGLEDLGGSTDLTSQEFILSSTEPIDIDIDPALIEQSPVLQRWLQEVPNVLSEIRHDPSFRTRLRFGYSQFPANEQAAGFNVGVEDAFVARTGLTVSADYQATFNGEREAYGADLRYYVLPLGSYVNLAPVVGYRYIETDRDTTNGANVGVRLVLVPSRTGAADISLTQSWVAPGTDEEVGITTLSFGYALTPNLRLSTDLEKQNAPQRKDSRVAIVLEWMP